MGRGLFYSHLKDMEGCNITFKIRKGKKAIEAKCMSVNLQNDDGLYMQVELPNGQWKLYTPEDKIHNVSWKPMPRDENLELLAEKSY